jgi:uncharacterized protein
MLKPVRLDDLRRAPSQTLTFEFKQFFDNFESLVPVEGKVRLIHGGNFFEAHGTAKTIVTLTCHRCLQQFNHRLNLKFKEIILIENTPDDMPLELDLELADLVERIPPTGEFDLEDWIYQNLYLELPDPLACRPDCEGMGISATEPPLPDPRWAILQQLHLEAGSQ